MEDRLSISFGGEAAVGFADWLTNHPGWYVRLTPQEGEPFDAALLEFARRTRRFGR